MAKESEYIKQIHSLIATIDQERKGTGFVGNNILKQKNYSHESPDRTTLNDNRIYRLIFYI